MDKQFKVIPEAESLIQGADVLLDSQANPKDRGASQKDRQERLLHLLKRFAASGVAADGSWLRLFGTGPEQDQGRRLITLLERLRSLHQATFTPDKSPVRFAALRAAMKRENLGGFIVGHDDETLSEYVCPGGKRLQWLTGFSGSAGTLLVLADRAVLLVDGRYALQAPSEVDARLVEVEVVASADDRLGELLTEAAGTGIQRVGADSRLFSHQRFERLKACCAFGQVELVARDSLVDGVWRDRPPKPLSPIVGVEPRFSGEGSAEKCQRISQKLRRGRVDCLVVEAPEDILWLLNVRAEDVPRAPLCVSKLIVHADGSLDWFLSGEQRQMVEAFALERVHLHDDGDYPEALGILGHTASRVLVDPSRVRAATTAILEASGAKLTFGDDPVLIAAARFNDTEQQGVRAAHLRDGVAMVGFMAEVARDSTPMPESALAEKLQRYRARQQFYQQDSFDAIIGSEDNAAICHYRPIPGEDRTIEWGNIVLIDSGGHYHDGTTDVTRVIAYDQGTTPLSREFRRHYTLVLKSLVALSTAIFPEGTSGGALDGLARRTLWAEKLDYDHGTGHGVGSNTMVHFGASRISKRGFGRPLEAGMLVSLEPGLYFAGRYGIRLENLALIQPRGQGWLGFETVTRVPFVRRMIDFELLTSAERAWLEDYHAVVYRDLAPLLATPDSVWLASETQTGE